MRLEMVGVQFDEAGQQIVALEIDAAAQRGALADLDDAAVLYRDVAREDAVAGDDRSHWRTRIAPLVEEFHRSGSVFLEEGLGGQRAKVAAARCAARSWLQSHQASASMRSPISAGKRGLSGRAGTPPTIV